MMTRHALFLPFILCSIAGLCASFTKRPVLRAYALQSSAASGDVPVVPVVTQLKQQLFARSAACDRGFGASRRDRDDINKLVESLKAIQQAQQTNPTRGLVPDNNNNNNNNNNAATIDEAAPIQGVWRLVYTSALDVLSLAASPLSLLQGIYQVIDANTGNSVNVIDLAPRIQTLLPTFINDQLETSLRLKVFTQARRRSDTRVGLRFLKVQAGLLINGAKPSWLPSSLFKGTLPQSALFDTLAPIVENIFGGGGGGGGSQDDSSNSDSNTSPGFFDVLYLDEDTLIIAQNAPGGIFVSTRMNEDISLYLEQ